MTIRIFSTILLYILSLKTINAQHFIIFFAYPKDNTSNAGHAFVGFVRKDQNLNQTILDGKWGFYPIDTTWIAFFKSKGKMVDEWKAFGKPEMRDFVVEVKDKAVYDECLSLKDYWENNISYSVLAKKTCVGFIRDIAVKIPELTIPNVVGGVFPRNFLDNLKAANKEIDYKSRVSLSLIPEAHPEIINDEEYKKPSNLNLKSNEQPDWLGGSTPEELGKILLNALKTNNPKTWAKTVLPIEKEVQNDNNDYKAWADWHATKRFELIRDGLEGVGITNWSLVEFSRVIYSPSKLTDGSKSAQNPIVEFTYKNKEFVGSFNFVIFYSKNGKFYVPGVQPRILSKGTLIRNKNN